MAATLTIVEKALRRDRLSLAAQMVEDAAEEPVKLKIPKCPICQVRVVTVKNKHGDETCADCAHWHYQHVQYWSTTKSRMVSKTVYVTLEKILAQQNNRRRERSRKTKPLSTKG